MTRVETEMQGEVSAVSQRANRYAVKIGETWYGGFGRCPVSRGSQVVLRFYEKGDWKNVVSIRLLEEPGLSDEEMAELLARFRERSNVIAEECLQDAACLLKRSAVQGAATPRNVVEFAQQLYQRRTFHVTSFIDRYVRQKRLKKREAPAEPASQPDEQELKEWAI